MGHNQVIALVDVGANSMNLTVLKNSAGLYAREQALAAISDSGHRPSINGNEF